MFVSLFPHIEICQSLLANVSISIAVGRPILKRSELKKNTLMYIYLLNECVHSNSIVETQAY